jgi:hypothetical protein
MPRRQAASAKYLNIFTSALFTNRQKNSNLQNLKCAVLKKWSLHKCRFHVYKCPFTGKPDQAWHYWTVTDQLFPEALLRPGCPPTTNPAQGRCQASNNSLIQVFLTAPVAQWIEHRIPKPKRSKYKSQWFHVINWFHWLFLCPGIWEILGDFRENETWRVHFRHIFLVQHLEKNPMLPHCIQLELF